MSNLECWVENPARGLFSWEHEVSDCHPRRFESGDAVVIDPFIDRVADSLALWPIYCMFEEYVSENICKVYIPPASDEEYPTWFDHGEGSYLIHRGYLYPQ